MDVNLLGYSGGGINWRNAECKDPIPVAFSKQRGGVEKSGAPVARGLHLFFKELIMSLGPVPGRLLKSTFECLPAKEQERLLFNIEAALLSKARRGKTLENLTLEVAADLEIAKNVVEMVSSSKKFKNKLGSRLL